MLQGSFVNRALPSWHGGSLELATYSFMFMLSPQNSFNFYLAETKIFQRGDGGKIIFQINQLVKVFHLSRTKRSNSFKLERNNISNRTPERRRTAGTRLYDGLEKRRENISLQKTSKLGSSTSLVSQK